MRSADCSSRAPAEYGIGNLQHAHTARVAYSPFVRGSPAVAFPLSVHSMLSTVFAFHVQHNSCILWSAQLLHSMPSTIIAFHAQHNSCIPCSAQLLYSMLSTILAFHAEHNSCIPCSAQFLHYMLSTILAFHTQHNSCIPYSAQFLHSMLSTILTFHAQHNYCIPCSAQFLHSMLSTALAFHAQHNSCIPCSTQLLHSMLSIIVGLQCVVVLLFICLTKRQVQYKNLSNEEDPKQLSYTLSSEGGLSRYGSVGDRDGNGGAFPRSIERPPGMANLNGLVCNSYKNRHGTWHRKESNSVLIGPYSASYGSLESRGFLSSVK